MVEEMLIDIIGIVAIIASLGTAFLIDYFIRSREREKIAVLKAENERLKREIKHLEFIEDTRSYYDFFIK